MLVGWVALGGALGAMLRYGMVTVIDRWAVFPVSLGVLFANILGSFMFGLCAVWLSVRFSSEAAKLFILVGGGGALTTFSTFSFQTMELFQKGDYGWALANIGLHNSLSLVCAGLGMKVWDLFNVA